MACGCKKKKEEQKVTVESNKVTTNTQPSTSSTNLTVDESLRNKILEKLKSK